MKTKLLRQVQEKILAEPELFQMAHWHVRVDDSCGTAHCIAGWAEVLGAPGKKHSLDKREYLELMGLRMSQADRLFYVSGWPKQFSTKYRRSVSAKNRAKIASDRIDHFIATRGME